MTNLYSYINERYIQAGPFHTPASVHLTTPSVQVGYHKNAQRNAAYLERQLKSTETGHLIF